MTKQEILDHLEKMCEAKYDIQIAFLMSELKDKLKHIFTPYCPLSILWPFCQAYNLKGWFLTHHL